MYYIVLLYISMFYFIILDSVGEDVTSEDLKHLPYLECVLKVRYLTNRLHFFVCVYCNRSHTRNTCTQQPLARLPNLFSVMLRLHNAINRADFVSWWML